MNQLAALFAAVALCTACVTVGAPPSGPRPIEARGTYVHEPSRFVFPEAWGKFGRVSISQFDSTGSNVGVGYNLDEPDAQVVVSLYVYPPLRDEHGAILPLATAFEEETAAVLEVHPGAIVSRPWTPPQTQNEEPSSGRAITLRYTDSFANQRQELESMLYLFEYDGWLVKYRITYRLSQSEHMNLLGQGFVSAFHWRGDS